MQIAAAMIGLFVLILIGGALLLIAGLLLAWCLFRALLRAVFGPVLTPMIASLRKLARVIRAIADGVHTFAAGIDQAANTLGAVTIPVPQVPQTADLWTLLAAALDLHVGPYAGAARVLSGDVTTTNLSLFGPVQTQLGNAADLLDSPAPAPGGVEQQLRTAAGAIDAIGGALESLFG